MNILTVPDLYKDPPEQLVPQILWVTVWVRERKRDSTHWESTKHKRHPSPKQGAEALGGVAPPISYKHCTRLL